MYQGINDNYKNLETDFVFEMQYHTAASWELKSKAHDIYEKFRVTEDPVAQQELFKRGAELAGTLALPEGVLDIPNLVKNPAPEMLQAYSQLINSLGKKQAAALNRWFVSRAGDNAKIDVYIFYSSLF